MSMHRGALHALANGLFLGAVLVGCMDLDVANPNAPDLEALFQDAGDVEKHLAGTFHLWHRIQTGSGLPPSILSSVSFQHTTANVCEAPYGGIPRVPIGNTPSSECVEVATTWHSLHAILASVRDGLAVLDSRPDFQAELGPDREARIRAFARFVQGVTHGSVALLFDRGVLVTEAGPPRGLVDAHTLMDGALAQLEEVASLADGAAWPAIPADWMSVEVTPTQLARLAHSYRARFRANVARTPLERTTVDWDAVRADAERGVTEDWLMAMGPTEGQANWRSPALQLLNSPSRRLTQASYFILGMADQGDGYSRWLAQPLWDRRPLAPSDSGEGEEHLLLITPDTRFPQGTTHAAQLQSPGSMFEAQPVPAPGWIRPDRGSWRWSLYRYHGGDAYSLAEEVHWPAMTVAELRLLRAEAFLRTGNSAAAAALVNESRVAHGLAPTDAAGANADCVPRLQDGSCGDLMEMLKWEKRLETYMAGAFLASWYFDGRGWGDLYAGTFLEFPVPCSELILLGEGCYTFGGTGSQSASPGSGYGWPDEG